MIGQEKIQAALQKLEQYIRDQSYRGFDPYDALAAPIFRFPPLRSNKIVRLASQQLFRRLPINIRSSIGIEKGLNPVTLGLSLQAISYLLVVYPERRSELEQEGKKLIDELQRISSKGYSGYCWGYDFDWQARYASFPAYYPTVVATGIITNGLFEFYRGTQNADAIEMCKSAVQFILKDLYRTQDGNAFCFSYSPGDKQVVYNATMKGARLLAQVYSVTKDSSLASIAEKTVRFVCGRQHSDGSWSYSQGDARTWVDNFHTGYILDCLDEYIRWTGDVEKKENLRKGIEYYIANFFQSECIPKYYSNALHPIDSTAAAQSILTLTRFGFSEKAVKVALWMIENMQDEDGYFYYRKERYFTNKISYMRWSNAWMYAALSHLIAMQAKKV